MNVSPHFSSRSRKHGTADALVWLMGAVAAGFATQALLRKPRVCGLQVWQGKTVVVTGGSRGLGLELVREWAGRGARVAFCARTAADVQRAAEELRRDGCEVLGLVCDVTSRDDVEKLIHTVVERWQRIDVLVNNAGVIQTGPIESMTLDDFRSSIDTHFWGPLYAVRAALPYLRRERGRIVNIASIGGKISLPHMLPYSTGKFALVGFSEGLRSELARHSVQVTTVCPGLMLTGSPRNASFKGNNQAEYAWFSISDSLPGLSMSANRAARQIVNACVRGTAEVVLSAPAKAAVKFNGLFPGTTSNILAVVDKLLPSPEHAGEEAKAGYQSYSKFSPSWATTLNERAAQRNNEAG